MRLVVVQGGGWRWYISVGGVGGGGDGLSVGRVAGVGCGLGGISVVDVLDVVVVDCGPVDCVLYIMF